MGRKKKMTKTRPGKATTTDNINNEVNDKVMNDVDDVVEETKKEEVIKEDKNNNKIERMKEEILDDNNNNIEAIKNIMDEKKKPNNNEENLMNEVEKTVVVNKEYDKKEDNDTTTSTTTTTNSKNKKPIIDRTSHKVIVHNILKFNRKNELENQIKEWLSYAPSDKPIKIHSQKKPPTHNFIKFTFDSEDMVDTFLNIMNTHNFKNRNGKAIYAARCYNNNNDDDYNDKKRSTRNDDDNNNNNNNNKKHSNEILDIRDVTTPLWKMKYSDQLIYKQRDLIKGCAMKIVKKIQWNFKNRKKEQRNNKHVKLYPVYNWLNGKNAIEILDIIPSPDIYEYRNKIEYTFGYQYSSNDDDDDDDKKKTPTIGFNVRG